MSKGNQHNTGKRLGAESKQAGLSRRGFLHGVGGIGALMGMGGLAGSASAAEAPMDAGGNVIPGFEKGQDDPNAARGWRPVSDRKVRVGIAGYNPKNGKIDEFGWRRALPPMWYPTHATAYYVSITGGRFTEVSCLGTESYYPVFKEPANPYKNPFGTEIALMKTSEGGISRMGVSWDMKDAHGEQGRVYGEKPHDKKIDGRRPPLPPGVGGGGHGGSHGQLTNHFIKSILMDEKPIVGIGDALNMTMGGVIAHKSALKGGKWMKIPQYSL